MIISVNMVALITKFNKNTGSINISKITTEFGLLIYLILFPILFFSFTSKLPDVVKITFLTMLFTQLFIRGTGYFNSGFLISIILISLLISENLSTKNKQKK